MTTLAPPKPPVLSLAPIRGVTHAAFRSSFARRFGGVDRAMAPYVVPEGGALPPATKLRDAMPACNRSLVTVPQILTDDPAAFVLTARAYLQAGCEEVNWNLGCPYPMVTRRKRGAGLLPFPDRIDAFLDIACGAMGDCVSVKLRLGLHDASEVGPVLGVLDRYPLAEVIVHPRTATQMYRGRADLDAFVRCVEASRHSLTYNGDIVDVTSFREKREALPTVRRFMIGRGAVSNPSLPTALREGAHEARLDCTRLLAMHDDLLEHYRQTLSGPAHVLHKMKELWGYWARSFDPKSKPLKKVLRAKRLEHLDRHAREVLRDV